MLVILSLLLAATFAIAAAPASACHPTPSGDPRMPAAKPIEIVYDDCPHRVGACVNTAFARECVVVG